MEEPTQATGEAQAWDYRKETDMADQYEWTTVSQDEVDETKVTFDLLGDEFIGTYIGTRQQANDNGSYTQLLFTGTDGLRYFVNANYSLTDGFKKVRPNNVVRITYVADKDTGQQSLMRIYRVDVARPARPAPAQSRTESASKS
jgi:hypothetical protein